jgi:hypothetical protein
LEEQQSCIREQGLVTPQDYISMLVWNYKRNSLPMEHLSLAKSNESIIGNQHLLASSNQDDASKEEENDARMNEAQM